jgi:tRNA modification GTPase
MNADDTITAVSTPPGRGGIGVVRISGPCALEIGSRLFLSDSFDPIPHPNRAYVGFVVSGNIQLDRAVLTYFKAPHSYSGEDVVELSCHGSPVILAQVIDLILRAGARAAEPGEFTLRAFSNRRIDLAQAQAVRDLIDAQTGYQARLAMRQLDGALSRRLAPLQQKLIDVIVHLESSIEFVEDDITPEAAASLALGLGEVIAELNEIARSFSVGRLVREGFDLAIVGRPNVGKSSVFNRLVGADRAIVTKIPGTTRDLLRETSSISGIPVRLIDTAGIRHTSDLVESIGIERTRAAIADADICVLVIDGAHPLTDDDQALLREAPPESRIVLLNKCDLPAPDDFGLVLEGSADPIRVSALTGQGFDDLVSALLGKVGGAVSPERDDAIITDARQHQALRSAIDSVTAAVELIEAGDLEEIVLLRLRQALSVLGEVTGETLTDDILNQIFSTFCIGK